MLPLVTLIVWANVPADAPAVKMPEAALMLPPPFTTDQVGAKERMLPLASRPVATN